MTTTQTATPERGTVQQIATCAACGSKLVKYGRHWAHQDSGSAYCWGEG